MYGKGGVNLQLYLPSIFNSSNVPKIKSGGEFVLELKPTRKLIKECREKHPELMIIGFKAETGIGREELLKRAAATLDGTKLDMVAANDVGKGGMGTEENEYGLLVYYKIR